MIACSFTVPPPLISQNQKLAYYVPTVPEPDARSTEGQEEQIDQPEDKKPATPPTEKTRQEKGEATDSHCGDTTDR